MAFVASILELTGNFQDIRSVDGFFGLPLYGQMREVSGDSGLAWRASLILFDEEVDEEEGVERVTEWFDGNREMLRGLSAHKALEMQVGLHPKEGSRFLTIPCRNLQVLGDLGVDLRVQYMQQISPTNRTDDNTFT